MKYLFALFLFAFLSTGCDKKMQDVPCTDCPDTDLIEGTYDPQPYTIELPGWLIQKPLIPENDSLTLAGVELGRYLFYDPILSSDSTQSCSSCHHLDKAFTDGRRFSEGVLGIEGTRNAMSIVNMAFHPTGFFWDGRAATLEAQALIPVEDHTELNESWEHVLEKLRFHKDYPRMFKEAFGIERKSEMTKELAVRAIAQFERSIVSFDSRYDRVIQQNEDFPTDEELRGLQLFFIEPFQQVDNHPGCSHCHNGPTFASNDFRNNGLDDVENLEDFTDKGRGAINNNVYDNGKFRVPTLRNIALTAPYMHDGRFETLEEVIDNYALGGHGVVNEDPNLQVFNLSNDDKRSLIAFLEMLTDTSFVKKSAYSNPFEE